MSDVNFTPTQARELLMTLVGATGDETVKEVLKAAILAKAATDGLKADQLSAEQVVRDLFIQNELHRVPPIRDRGPHNLLGAAATRSGLGLLLIAYRNLGRRGPFP